MLTGAVSPYSRVRFRNTTEKPLTYPQQVLGWRLDCKRPNEPCTARSIQDLRDLHAKRFIAAARTVKPEKYPLSDADYQMLSRLMSTFFYAPLAKAVTGTQIDPIPDDYVIRFRTRQLPELLGYRSSEEYEAEVSHLLIEAYKR